MARAIAARAQIRPNQHENGHRWIERYPCAATAEREFSAVVKKRLESAGRRANFITIFIT